MICGARPGQWQIHTHTTTVPYIPMNVARTLPGCHLQPPLRQHYFAHCELTYRQHGTYRAPRSVSSTHVKKKGKTPGEMIWRLTKIASCPALQEQYVLIVCGVFHKSNSDPTKLSYNSVSNFPKWLNTKEQSVCLERKTVSMGRWCSLRR